MDTTRPNTPAADAPPAPAPPVWEPPRVSRLGTLAKLTSGDLDLFS